MDYHLRKGAWGGDGNTGGVSALMVVGVVMGVMLQARV